MDKTAQNILVATAIEHNGDWNAICKSIRSKICPDDGYIALAKRLIEEGKAITVLDADYPQRLLKSTRPPFALFFLEGSKEILRGKKAPSYVETTRKMEGKELETRNATFDKLMAEGVDVVYSTMGKVHYRASNGANAVFTAQARYNPTPASVADAKATASAMADRGFWFKLKNYSGEMMAIAVMLHNGGDVYAMPHEYGADDMCNKLIAEGAIPLDVYMG